MGEVYSHLSEEERQVIQIEVGNGASIRGIGVLLQCLFDRFGSVFPQCGLMVFPGVVIVSR